MEERFLKDITEICVKIETNILYVIRVERIKLYEKLHQNIYARPFVFILEFIS